MSRIKGLCAIACVVLLGIAVAGCESSSQSNNNEPSQPTNTATPSQSNTDTATDTASTSATTSEPPQQQQPPNNGKIELRLNLKEGQSFQTEMTTVQIINQNMFGQEVESIETSKNILRYDITSVDEAGNVVMTMIYEQIYRKREGPAGISEFDSTSDNPDSSEAKVFGALVGQSVQMTLSPYGEVQDVRGMRELIDHLMNSLDGGQEAAVFKTAFESMFGEDTLKEAMQQSFVLYSQDALEVGDGWSQSLSLMAGLPFSMNNQWTVTERTDGKVLLDFSAEMTTNPDAPPVELGPLSYSYPTMEGTASGTLEVDEETGWVVNSRLTQIFTGEMKMEGVDALIGDEPIPISGQIEITIKSTETS